MFNLNQINSRLWTAQNPLFTHGVSCNS